MAGIDGNRTHRGQVSLPPDGFEGRGRHQPVNYSHKTGSPGKAIRIA